MKGAMKALMAAMFPGGNTGVTDKSASMKDTLSIFNDYVQPTNNSFRP